MRHLPRLLGLAFLLAALFPIAAVGLRLTQSVDRSPFPMEYMAGAGLFFVGMGALWLGGPPRVRAGVWLASAGGVISLLLGLMGIAGSWISVGQPCGVPDGGAAASWPAGACRQALESGSWLIGLYLVLVGLLGAISLAVVDWQRRERTGLR